MNRCLFILPLIGSLIIAAVISPAALAQVLRTDLPRSIDMVPGVVWVQFAEDASLQLGVGKTGLGAFDRAATALGVYDIQQAFPFVDAAVAKREFSKAAYDLNRVYAVYFDAVHNPLRVAAALEKVPGVTYAEPLYSTPVPRLTEGDVPTGGLREAPNDPLYGQMPYLKRLKMEGAWDLAKGEDSDVVIAVVDGHIDWRHPELARNIWTNPGEIPGNGIDDDDNGLVDDVRGWSFWNESPDPGSVNLDLSHGTAMASIASAVTDNGQGMTGTSWNATIMPLDVSCDAEGTTVCYVLTGVAYAAQHGADIVNVSIGSVSLSNTAQTVYRFAADRGVLVVGSAGNFVTNNDKIPIYPEALPTTLSVGGTRSASDVNAFNYGRSVNVFVPATDIVAVSGRGKFGYIGGTSAATALVSGVAALVKTRFRDYTGSQLREQVRVTAESIDQANDASLSGLLGRGRVNAYRAVTETESPAVRVTAGELAQIGPSDDPAGGTDFALDLTFTNYLADAAGLELELISESPWVIVAQGLDNAGTLASGTSHTAQFILRMASDTPYRSEHVLHTRAVAESYDDAPDLVRVQGNAGRVALHQTEAMAVSITSEGNIGFLDHARNSSGVGFVVRDTSGEVVNLLFEAGLMIATGPAAVRDAARSAFGRQQMDLVPKEDASLTIASPGVKVTEEGRMELVDKGSPGSLGLDVLQESFVNATMSDEDFITFKYTVRNTSDRSLENVHVGLFADWDINQQAYTQDAAGVVPGRRLGYQADSATSPRLLAGILALSSNAPFHYQGVNLAQELGSRPFDDATKWDFLSGGVGTPPSGLGDYIQVVGLGPYVIGPGAEVEVAFAIVAGSSQADLLENADAAQELWDTTLGAGPNTTVGLQLIHNVAGADIDVYLDGGQLLDDWRFQSATGFSDLDAGGHTLAITDAADADAGSPLVTLEFDFEAGTSNQIIAYGSLEEVRLAAVEDVRTSENDDGSVGLYLAHGARNLGPVALRVLDPDQDNVVQLVLADSIGYGDVGGYHTLEARAFNIEVARPLGGPVLEVYSLDFSDAAGQALSLGISGAGTSAAEGLTLMGVLPSGDVLLPMVVARAVAGLQLVHNVAGMQIDVYVDDDLRLDDWAFQSATAFSDIVVGRHTMDVVEAAETDNSGPLAALEFDFVEGTDNQIMAIGSTEEVRLVVVEDVRTEEEGSDMASFFVAHGARDLGRVAMRLLDPDDSNRSVSVLEANLGFGESGGYHTTQARALNVELAMSGSGRVIDVYAFDFEGVAGQSLGLALSGPGRSAAEGVTIMGVLPSGQVQLPSAVVTEVDFGAGMPEAFELLGNFPNPFNPATRILFDLPARSQVAVQVIDVLGRTVMVVPEQEFEAGTQRAVEVGGASLASGIYLYRVTAKMETQTVVRSGRMTLVR